MVPTCCPTAAALPVCGTRVEAGAKFKKIWGATGTQATEGEAKPNKEGRKKQKTVRCNYE